MSISTIKIEVGASYFGIICYFESKIDPDHTPTFSPMKGEKGKDNHLIRI